MTNQKEFNANHIKIARINRAVKYALNLNILDGSENIYMTMEQVDALAKERPESYLKTLEWISDMLKQPDFVGKREQGRRIAYIKEYYNNLTKKFEKVVVSVIKDCDHRQVEWWYATCDGSAIIHDTGIDEFYRVEGARR